MGRLQPITHVSVLCARNDYLVHVMCTRLFPRATWITPASIARIVRNMYRVGMPTGSRLEPSDFNEALMTVVRAKMGMLQMNIADLSRDTDIPRSTLSRIVNSKRQADIDQLRRIAIALKMPMAQLMTSADEILAGKDPF